MPPGPPFGLTIVTFRAKWRNDAFMNKNELQNSISKIEIIENQFPSKMYFNIKISKMYLPILEFASSLPRHK